MESIIQQNKTCYVCGNNKNIMRHHIFFGTGKRALSEKYGLTIYLCGVHHNLSSVGIHFNKELDNQIKAMAQKRAMNYYKWQIEDWLKIFRRSYI